MDNAAPVATKNQTLPHRQSDPNASHGAQQGHRPVRGHTFYAEDNITGMHPLHLHEESRNTHGVPASACIFQQKLWRATPVIFVIIIIGRPGYP